MRKTALGLALAVFAGAAPFAVAPRAAEEAKPLAGTDTQFLAKAIQDGMAEVEMGKVAEKKASNAEVKKFAQQMVKDHTAEGKKLGALAQKHKIEADGTYGTPPLKPSAEEADKKRDLAGMSGKDFDRSYIAAMVEDHQKAVDAFKDEAKNGKDAEVSKAAEAALPTLEKHLKMAQDLAGKVGATQ